VAVSNFVRCSARNSLAARMIVIHNGVDQELFGVVDKKTKADLRSKLNLPHDKPVFLSVGFLSKRKSPITVIKAFLQSKVSQTAVLVLLGDGALREECLSLARANDNIHIVGFVKNVRDYLHASDIFISASLTEGCPNAILEAMACGLPCILSDIRAHREIEQYSPVSTKLFQVNNVQRLVDKIHEMLDQDYDEMSHSAVQSVTHNFSAKMMSENYQSVYASISHEKQMLVGGRRDKIVAQGD
jgi:glycosyltransferase involved in cell wall biosynthesis